MTGQKKISGAVDFPAFEIIMHENTKPGGRSLRHLIHLLAALAIWSTAATAHELQPAIADLTAVDGRATVSLSFNAEALVSGVDLDGVADTNDTDASDRVDALRALTPDELSPQIEAFLPELLSGLNLRAGDAPIALEMTALTIPEIGNIELPRESVIVLEGSYPLASETLQADWPARFGNLVLRQQGVEDPYTGYLTSGASSDLIPVAGGVKMSAGEAFVTYIPVGFDHILPKGLDHILFVLGLFFLSASVGTLLWQISAFTFAHTVTLALGALGYVTIPGSIVEPLIAASIVYVAIENVVTDKLNKWRPVIIFGFGLLHGLGFASVLQEFGLPASQFVPALIGFNIGVEIGQLTVIALAFLLVYVALQVDRGRIDETFGMLFYAVLAILFAIGGLIFDTPEFVEVMGASAKVFLWPLAGLSVLCGLSAYELDKLEAYRRFVAIPASVAVAAVGAYWFVERVFL